MPMHLKLFFPSMCSLVTVGIVWAYDYAGWSADELLQQAMEFQSDGKIKQALQLFDKAVKTEPSNPETYLNRGVALCLLGQIDKALTDEQQVLKLAQGNSNDANELKGRAHQNIAAIYLKTKELSKAVAEANKAMHSLPDDPGIHRTFALILIQSGMKKEALSHLDKASEIYGRNHDRKQQDIVEQMIRKLRADKPVKQPSSHH